HMLGTARHPEAHLDATLAPDSNPAEVLQALCDGPLTRARQSTGRSDLPLQVNFRTSRHKPRRTE
ncbi:alkaline shock response membrane anchor protein AmaP, partial [Streptomyces sp. SID7760]|nr:alkaline shock response membrane anchor protein AmaP [Streptomyces sp. SID7760]